MNGSATGVQPRSTRKRRRAQRPRPACEGAASRPEPAGPRVAYLVSRFPVLTETFVLNEIRAMDALGAVVEIYPLLRHHQHVVHPEARAWVRRARFQPFLSWRILRANAYFLLHRPGVYLRLIGDVLRGVWGSANFLVGALGIFPKCVLFACDMRQRGIQHIHAHFANHPALAAFIVHRLTGIPYSFTAHGSDLHVDRHMLAEKVAAAAFAVTISDFNREVIVRECGESVRGKIRVVHCGVEPAVFLPAATPRSGGGPLRIVCVASFVDVKGHRFLVDACGILARRGVDFQCELVGEGPLRRAVERQVERLGLQDRVRFQGGLPRGDVARLLAQADVAALASHPTRQGKREGIPVALMEAMASGLPIVATAISGIPELVESGKEGILVPPADARALAEALQHLAQDEPMRQRMGEAAREKVLCDFSLEANARALLAHFRQAARPGPGMLAGRAADGPLAH